MYDGIANLERSRVARWPEKEGARVMWPYSLRPITEPAFEVAYSAKLRLFLT